MERLLMNVSEMKKRSNKRDVILKTATENSENSQRKEGTKLLS